MAASRYPDLRISEERIQKDIMALADITDPDLPYTRQAFTDYDNRGRAWLVEAMREVGLIVDFAVEGDL